MTKPIQIHRLWRVTTALAIVGWGAGCFSDKTEPSPDASVDATEERDQEAPAADTSADAPPVDAGVDLPATPPPPVFKPGRAVVAPGTHERFSDVLLTSGGTVLAVSGGPGYVGEVWVTRSSDNGRSWQTTNLGNEGTGCTIEEPNPEGNNHLYNGKVFQIDEDAISVGGTQGSCQPYDAHVKTTSDGGRSYSETWVNISDSADLHGNKSVGPILRLANGKLAGFFAHSRIRWRVADAIDKLVDSPRQTWEADEEENIRWYSVAVHPVDGSVIVIRMPMPNATLLVARSDDHASTFTPVGDLELDEPWNSFRLWIEPGSGRFHVCGVTGAATASVMVTHSDDGGKTWAKPSVYLDGLSPGQFWARCHIGPRGVTVAYLDSLTGKAKVILPKADPAAAGCADGSDEERYGDTMARCEVKGGSIYEQDICGLGWHICNHTEYLASLGSSKPVAGYWLNAYVHLIRDPDETYAVYDNPAPGCYPWKGVHNVDAWSQAVTDIDLVPEGLPLIETALMTKPGDCATIKHAGAMCCRGW